MYYLILSFATVLFGLGFLLNQTYERSAGNSFKALCLLNIFGNFAGLTVLLVVNKFRFEATPFTVIYSFITSLGLFAYSFCAIKALGKINLSLYSVFAMLGGMTLPFVYGIAFCGEGLSAGKILCFVFVCVSLAFTVSRDEKMKSGVPFYIGVFVLNGMSGVFSKYYAVTEFDKTSIEGYSIWIAISGIVISAAILPFVIKKGAPFRPKAVGIATVFGMLGRLGNYLLLVSLAHLPASAQYPMVTGGTMIVSTLLCFFTDSKPKKKDVVPVALSFAGIILLIAFDK